MQIVHFIILPFIIFTLSVILQQWLSQEEFNDFYIFYFIGILIGLVIIFILSFINPIFLRTANHLSIFIKSFFVNGLLYTSFIVFTLYILVEKILNSNFTNSWSMATVLSFSFIMGIFSIIFIMQGLSDGYPSSLLLYVSYLSILLFLSLIISFGLTHYIDAFSIVSKILWALFTFGVPIILLTIYNYLIFYNYIWHFFSIVLFIGFYIFFEIDDFKLFRGAR